MTLLPIVVRELRVAARRKSTYSARFGTACAAAVGGAGMMVVLSEVPLVPGIGWTVFQGLACVSFAHCLTLASNTTDCVSEEKREGTLGLLFLTDLSGWDVALGKLCANSLKSFYAVLGAFPVVAIVLTLGGVSLGQFCKVGLALLNVFFFAHAAGLLASVLCRALSWASAVTAALLFGFLAAPPILALAINHGRFGYGTATLLLAAVSPGYSLAQMMLPTGGRFYWTSLLMGHLIGWLFLGIASWRLPYCWQEKVGPVRLRWRDRFRQWAYGPPPFREELRRRLAGINPFLWLLSRDRLTPLILPVILLLAGGFWIWAWCEAGRLGRIGVLSFAVCTNHLCLLAGVASEASSHLLEQRRSGALEFVLCTTPLQVEDVLAAHWELLRRRFLRPLLAVLVFDAVAAVLSQGRLVDANSEDRSQFIWFLAGAMLMLVADAIAAGWVGMWRAMVQRRTRKTAWAGSATVETVGLLVFMPLTGLWMIAIILLIVQRDFLERFFSDFGPVFGVWFLLALSAAFGFGSWARKKLLTQFREMAAVQRGEPLGLFGQLGRRLGRAFRRR